MGHKEAFFYYEVVRRKDSNSRLRIALVKVHQRKEKSWPGLFIIRLHNNGSAWAARKLLPHFRIA
jgi:hypothetical protein